MTRTATSAREPWRRAAEGFGDPRLDALAYAILAPNPHNMQPWQLELGEGLSMTVSCDPDRLLPETDPPNRQITIGFGCFLELLRQAAAEKGYRADITPFPEGEPEPRLDRRPVATVTLVEDASIERDPLFGGVLTRRTNRLEYDTAVTPEADALLAVSNASVPGVTARTSTDERMVTALRELCAAAWEVEWSTAATRRESIAVMRIGKREVADAPYGLALDGALNSFLGVTGLMTREAMDDPESTSYIEGFKMYDRACRSATAFAWTTTRDNSRTSQLEAGRAWVRMQLAANAAGLAFHPLSQPLQEFPEMTEHYENAHRMLGGNDGSTVQMLVRLGYAPDVGPSPREALESRLLA